MQDKEKGGTYRGSRSGLQADKGWSRVREVSRGKGDMRLTFGSLVVSTCAEKLNIWKESGLSEFVNAKREGRMEI